MSKKRTKKVESEEFLKALEEFGCVLQSRSRRVSNDLLYEKLTAMTENGVLFPIRDSKTWITLKSRAAHYNIDVEDYIRSTIGFNFDHVERAPAHGNGYVNPAQARENHIKVLQSMIDENGKIACLAKFHPSTYKYVLQLAKKNSCSVSQVINALFDVPNGTYEYLSSKSAYVMSNSNFVGNDENFKNAMAKVIRLAMDENNIVTFSNSASSVSSVLRTIAEMNAISMQEAINLFVPEAKVSKQKFARLDEEDVKNMIASCDDGTGCVDTIFNNEGFVRYLRRLAGQHGRTVSEEILSYGDFYVTKGYYEVDYLDYCKTLLTAYFGEGGDASDLINRDRRLYYIIVALKNNFPGGALDSMQDIMETFGFGYDGGKKRTGRSKYHDAEYVKSVLLETFKTTKITESLSGYPKAVRALTIYAGKLGVNFVDALKTLGFDYEYNGGENLKKHLFLSAGEYEKYKQLKLAAAKTESGNAKFEAQNAEGKEKN